MLRDFHIHGLAGKLCSVTWHEEGTVSALKDAIASAVSIPKVMQQLIDPVSSAELHDDVHLDTLPLDMNGAVELMLVKLSILWDENRMANAAFRVGDGGKTVTSVSCSNYPGIIGNVSFIDGSNRFAVSGPLVEKGDAYVGVTVGTQPEDIDFDQVTDVWCVLRMYDGDIYKPGRSGDNNKTPFHGHKVVGSSLEVRVEFKADGLAEIFFEIDGIPLADGKSACDGLQGPLYPLFSTPVCSHLNTPLHIQ